MASPVLWLISIVSIACLVCNSKASETFSSEQTTYTEEVCQFDWQCRNLTEQAYEDHIEMYANSSVNSTSIPEAPVYVCCNANISTTSDYAFNDDEDFEMSPGVCCIQEPLPLWVTILLVIIFFILCTGCCILCCVVRPKLEALMNRFQTPRVTTDNIQTMAALKVLSTDTNLMGGGQPPNQGHFVPPAPTQPVAYSAGVPPPNYPTQPVPPSPYAAAPPYAPQGVASQPHPGYAPQPQTGYPAQEQPIGYPSQTQGQPGYPTQPGGQPGYPTQPGGQPGYPMQGQQQPPYPTNYGAQYPSQPPYGAPPQAAVQSDPSKPQMTVEVPTASAA